MPPLGSAFTSTEAAPARTEYSLTSQTPSRSPPQFSPLHQSSPACCAAGDTPPADPARTRAKTTRHPYRVLVIPAPRCPWTRIERIALAPGVDEATLVRDGGDGGYGTSLN